MSGPADRLADDTLELVALASESHHEAEILAHVRSRLAAIPDLSIVEDHDAVVAARWIRAYVKGAAKSADAETRGVLEHLVDTELQRAGAAQADFRRAWRRFTSARVRAFSDRPRGPLFHADFLEQQAHRHTGPFAATRQAVAPLDVGPSSRRPLAAAVPAAFNDEDA